MYAIGGPITVKHYLELQYRPRLQRHLKVLEHLVVLGFPVHLVLQVILGFLAVRDLPVHQQAQLHTHKQNRIITTISKF